MNDRSPTEAAAPRVTVVLPAYDEPGFLADAVRSVAAQTMGDFELLVVDDGSPRETEIRQAFAAAAAGDSRMRLIRQPNGGGSAARNRGVQEARGDWIAFLDHDDRWLPQRLEAQLHAVDAADAGGPRPGLVFCQFREFDEGQPPREPFPPRAPDLQHGTLAALLRATLIRTLSVVLIARDALPAGEPWFRADLAVANDIELYYRLARRRPFLFVGEALVEKRRHERNVTRNLLRMHQEAVCVADELAESLAGRGSRLEGALLRQRLVRHLLGAARAARKAGHRVAAIGFARRAVGLSRWRLDARLELLSAALGRQRAT